MHLHMALSTMQRPDGSGLPLDHSVDAHIEAERAALARERAAAAPTATDERWRLIRSVGLGLALAGTIAIGWHQLKADASPTTSCPAAAKTVDGSTLRQDPGQGCAWVDADGNPVPTDAQGNPTN